jgi:hypothetical protein
VVLPPPVPPPGVTVTVTDSPSLPPVPVHCSVNVVVLLNAALVSLPETALVPVQPSEAVQAVAFVDDHVSVVVPLTLTVAGLALNVTTGAGGGGALLMLTVTERLVVPPAPVQPSVNVLAALNAAVCSVPEAALFPAQAPEAVQPVALVDDHVNCERPPLATEVGLAENVTVGAASSDTVAVRCVVPPAPVQPSVNVEATAKGPTD